MMRRARWESNVAGELPAGPKKDEDWKSDDDEDESGDGAEGTWSGVKREPEDNGERVVKKKRRLVLLAFLRCLKTPEDRRCKFAKWVWWASCCGQVTS
jgi:hypothetical protein